MAAKRPCDTLQCIFIFKWIIIFFIIILTAKNCHIQTANIKTESDK